MNDKMPIELQRRENPLVSFAHALTADRGRRVLGHEHWIRTVKFKNGVDVCARKRCAVSVEQLLKLPLGALGFLRTWGSAIGGQGWQGKNRHEESRQKLTWFDHRHSLLPSSCGSISSLGTNFTTLSKCIPRCLVRLSDSWKSLLNTRRS